MLNPQHFTVPSESSAQVWLLPAETATACSDAASASTGMWLEEPVPSPSSPLKPEPQHLTAPVVMTAHECPPPAVIDAAPVSTWIGWYVIPDERLPMAEPLAPKQWTVVSDFRTQV